MHPLGIYIFGNGIETQPTKIYSENGDRNTAAGYIYSGIESEHHRRIHIRELNRNITAGYGYVFGNGTETQSAGFNRWMYILGNGIETQPLNIHTRYIHWETESKRIHRKQMFRNGIETQPPGTYSETVSKSSRRRYVRDRLTNL